MKRFTLRTALVAVICLLLLTGIALAASGVFSTKDSLDMYTSAPTDGAGVNIQTDLHQTGGDLPDLTVKVRDAVFDGATAYVTVEYRVKNPEKDMILSHWDTHGWGFVNVQRWPGYSQHPLSDPQTDPRRKLVVYDDGALAYGLYNHAITDAIYESDGVLVLTWRIRLDSDQPFDPCYFWDRKASIYDESKAAEYQEATGQVLQKIAGPEPLELTMIAEIQEWIGGVKGYNKSLYFGNVGIQLDKTPSPVIRGNQDPITQGEMTLTNAKITFTKLATYMDIQTKFVAGIGTRPEDGGELGSGLAFEWLDDQGNVVPCLGESSAGTYDFVTGTYHMRSGDSEDFEFNRYTAFWPAVEKIPDTITLRAYSHYTDERLATFTIPLSAVPESPPAPSPTLIVSPASSASSVLMASPTPSP